MQSVSFGAYVTRTTAMNGPLGWFVVWYLDWGLIRFRRPVDDSSRDSDDRDPTFEGLGNNRIRPDGNIIADLDVSKQLCPGPNVHVVSDSRGNDSSPGHADVDPRVDPAVRTDSGRRTDDDRSEVRQGKSGSAYPRWHAETQGHPQPMHPEAIEPAEDSG